MSQIKNEHSEAENGALKTFDIKHTSVDETINLCEQIENALKGHDLEAVIESISLIHQEVWYKIKNAPIDDDQKQYYFNTFKYHIEAMQERLTQQTDR